jgi:hypothetical protein
MKGKFIYPLIITNHFFINMSWRPCDVLPG